MFDRVLIANRGEIALRIARTLSRLGVSPVTVYTELDRTSPHWRAGDRAVMVSPGGYLAIDELVDAARATGAEAVHPGYGFLSESADFADAVTRAGLAFVGPPAAAMAAMGDKITAKATVAAAGVPVLDGFGRRGADDDELAAAAESIGYPLLIKPSAGGGGKGMAVVERPDELRHALQQARHAARAWFGEDTVFVERLASGARHIEVQVLLDRFGAGVHLGERECSLQRRHQKLIEEAPASSLGGDLRERMASAALSAARSVGYENAGTVEFLAAAEQFWFLEMNTRLQVEHPVTELVTDLDLVEWQLRIAAGEPLGFTQHDVRVHGHAVEARVCAEDPARGFLPTGGRIWQLREPSRDHVRVDSGIVEGGLVPADFDPLLAKVVAWGTDRSRALRRLDAALADTSILGMATNIGFLRRLLQLPEVVAGQLDTDLVERVSPSVVDGTAPDHVARAAVLVRLIGCRHEAAGLWDQPAGWRLSGPAWISLVLRPAGEAATGATVQALEAAGALPGPAVVARVQVAGNEQAEMRAELRDGELVVTGECLTRRYRVAMEGDELWIGYQGGAWSFRIEHPASLATASAQQAAGQGLVRAPMPGTVRRVSVDVGETVAAGQPLVVVEAMKMEHELVATAPGVVTEVAVRAGQTVALDQLLVVVEPAT